MVGEAGFRMVEAMYKEQTTSGQCGLRDMSKELGVGDDLRELHCTHLFMFMMNLISGKVD